MKGLMVRLLSILVVVLIVRLIWHETRRDASPTRACLGGRLGTEGRQMAFEQGLEVDLQRDCILEPLVSRAPDGVADNSSASRTAPAAPAPDAPESRTLTVARTGVATAIHDASGKWPVPVPPATLFVPVDLANARGATLPAFVTPDPRDGRRHPAIVWIKGGNSSPLDDFWTPGSEAADENVSAFRKAGVVVMFPSLRGGHPGSGDREYFFGEADDVLAAADRLARLPYVDPERIYLGGHSTGGTLVLLTSEQSARFRAVFAFGPVARIERYPTPMVPPELGRLPETERRLRSPIGWLHGIASPTYIIEGRESPNVGDAEEMCARSPKVTCLLIPGADHFSVLSRVTTVVAARMSIGQDVERGLRIEDFPAIAGRPD
jgi:pimeloyl-ACP methyl ester carboxylesterase